MVVCGCGLGIDDANVCLVNSQCRTNTDCPTGQYCALSRLPGVPVGDGSATFYGQAWGYFCTTPTDRCRSSDDCAAEVHDHSCVYYTTTKQWACGGGP
jgi:Cys-rich repeat protein